MKEKLKKIIESNNVEAMHYLSETYDEMLHYLKDKNKMWHDHICYHMHIYAYGNHLTEHQVMCEVSKFENEDGTSGQHWDINTTTSVNKYGFNNYDWYYVLNMMYSDYYSQKFTTDDYVRMACQFLKDKDADKHKLLKNFYSR